MIYYQNLNFLFVSSFTVTRNSFRQQAIVRRAYISSQREKAFRFQYMGTSCSWLFCRAANQHSCTFYVMHPYLVKNKIDETTQQCSTSQYLTAVLMHSIMCVTRQINLQQCITDKENLPQLRQVLLMLSKDYQDRFSHSKDPVTHECIKYIYSIISNNHSSRILFTACSSICSDKLNVRKCDNLQRVTKKY